MAARRIKDVFMYEEWEFDSWEELDAAVLIEAVVYGDNIRKFPEQKQISIYNYRQGSIRWMGKVR